MKGGKKLDEIHKSFPQIPFPKEPRFTQELVTWFQMKTIKTTPVLNEKSVIQSCHPSFKKALFFRFSFSFFSLNAIHCQIYNKGSNDLFRLDLQSIQRTRRWTRKEVVLYSWLRRNNDLFFCRQFTPCGWFTLVETTAWSKWILKVNTRNRGWTSFHPSFLFHAYSFTIIY